MNVRKRFNVCLFVSWMQAPKVRDVVAVRRTRKQSADVCVAYRIFDQANARWRFLFCFCTAREG